MADPRARAIVALSIALLVGVGTWATLKLAAPPPSPPPSGATQVDQELIGLYRRLNRLEAQVLALPSANPDPTTLAGLRSELAALRASPLEAEARPTLERLSRRLGSE